MATIRLTKRDFWLNRNGEVAKVVYTPIDPKAKLEVPAFVKMYDEVEALKDATKADFSKVIFGDDRLTSVNDRQFDSFKRNFNRDYVQEPFMDSIATNSFYLAGALTQIAPEQVERHLLSKNRRAKTAAFKLDIPTDAPQETIEAIKKYNNAVDSKGAYHAQIEQMDLVGDKAYVTGRLKNITPMQMAVVMSATGSRAGDFSKIARSYKNMYAANFLEDVNTFGVQSFIGTNVVRGRNLEVAHRASLEGLENAVEEEITNLGVGVSAGQISEVYKLADKKKQDFANKYQNAATDAKYVISDLGSKVYNEASRVIRYQAAEAKAA